MKIFGFDLTRQQGSRMEFNLKTLENIGVIIKNSNEDRIKISQLCELTLENNYLRYEDYANIRDLIRFTISKQKPSIEIHEIFAILTALFTEMNNGGICISLEKGNFISRLSNLFGDIVESENIYKSFLKSLRNGDLNNIIADFHSDIFHNKSKNKYSDIYKQLLFKQNNNFFIQIQPLVHYIHNENESYLFLQRHFLYSIRLQDAIKQFIPYASTNKTSKNTIQSAFQKAKLEKAIPEIGVNFEPGEEQKLALALVRLKNFLIISGGPGTGKTTLVKRILYRMLEENPNMTPEEIFIAAPTGKAAQRISESIKENIPLERTHITQKLLKIEPKTIHRILKFSPYHNTFQYHKDNKLVAKLVIVDEVSMVDITLMTSLLETIPEEAKVILLGDKNQLPSVDSGAVLSDLVPKDDSIVYYSKNLQDFAESELGHTFQNNKIANSNPGSYENVVILKENHREEKGNKNLKNSIFHIAESINNTKKTKIKDFINRALKDFNLFDTQKKWLASGVYFLDTQDYDIENTGKHFHTLIKSFFEYTFSDTNMIESLIFFLGIELNEPNLKNPENRSKLNEIFQTVHKNKILPIVHNGLFGVNIINYHLKEYWKLQIQKTKKFNTSFDNVFSGLPIIITKNDYKKNLFNGDIGIVLETQNGLFAVFEKLGNYIHYPIDLLHSFELAFAITVHKSQGSEYDSVVIPLPSNHKHRILSKEILYTGITRAKRFALIYSNKQSLEKAISNKIQRETGPFKVWV